MPGESATRLSRLAGAAAFVGAAAAALPAFAQNAALPYGNAAARGPNLAGVYGSRLTLADGSQVLANDAYLRDAILNPSQHVTAGFAPIMPTYQGQISEDGLIDLVEYIKNLQSNYRVQQTQMTSDSNQAAPTTPPAGTTEQR